jgi:hypothetical protein
MAGMLNSLGRSRFLRAGALPSRAGAATHHSDFKRTAVQSTPDFKKKHFLFFFREKI